MCRTQRWKFRRSLLHPVLAEHRLAGGERLSHGLRRLGLGNGDQGNVLRRAASRDGGVGDAVFDPAEVVDNGVGVGHAGINTPNTAFLPPASSTAGGSVPA